MYLLTQNSLVFEKRWKIDWDGAQSLTNHIILNDKIWLNRKKNLVSDIHSAILNFSAILDLRDVQQALYSLFYFKAVRY
jgi:hypothetical protein